MPISVTLSGIIIDVNKPQSAKALSPIPAFAKPDFQIVTFWSWKWQHIIFLFMEICADQRNWFLLFSALGIYCYQKPLQFNNFFWKWLNSTWQIKIACHLIRLVPRHLLIKEKAEKGFPLRVRVACGNLWSKAHNHRPRRKPRKLSRSDWWGEESAQETKSENTF